MSVVSTVLKAAMWTKLV